MLPEGTQANNLVGQGAIETELGCLALLIVMSIWALMNANKYGRLSIPTLCGIAGFSIFWQEYYADWGGYLLWSSKFHMLPWGSTLWTTPLKPTFMMASYPLFMCGAFSMMIPFSRRMIAMFPNTNSLVVCLAAAGPVLFAINFLLEYLSVGAAGQWTYVDILGPALVTDKGAQPVLYPGISFGVFGAVTTWLILRTDELGRPTFERFTRAAAPVSKFAEQFRRAVAWMIVWNLTYWIFLCTPTILIRVIFGTPNALVP